MLMFCAEMSNELFAGNIDYDSTSESALGMLYRNLLCSYLLIHVFHIGFELALFHIVLAHSRTESPSVMNVAV